MSAIEIDVVAKFPSKHHESWPTLSSPRGRRPARTRTVEDAKLRAIGRFGAMIRRLADDRGSKVAPAYAQLNRIASGELPVTG